MKTFRLTNRFRRFLKTVGVEPRRGAKTISVDVFVPGKFQPVEPKIAGRITCRICGESKPLDQMKTGGTKRRPCRLCKACDARLVRTRGESSMERKRASAREYQRRMRDAGIVRELTAKDAARRALQLAYRSGRIIRPTACEECLAPCKPEGHHPDYSKPLDVKWLCCRCHRKTHRRYPDLVAL